MSAEPSRQRQDALAAPADQDRRPWLLHGERQALEAVGVDVAAVDGDVAAGPVGAQESDHLAQPLDAHARPVHRDAESFVLGRHPPGAEAGLHSTLGEQIEGGELLGEHDRMVEVDVEHAAADAQRRRRRGGRHHRGDGGHVDRAVPRLVGDRPRPEVVVGGEQRAVAEALDAAGRLVPTRGRRGIEGLDREAERAWCRGSHGPPVCRPATVSGGDLTRLRFK